MTDLTKITTPFGLLDAETQEALKAHGGPYEVLNNAGWSEREAPTWVGWMTYRVKPQPPKPREWWVTMYDGAVWDKREQAEKHARDCEVVHVREVLE